MTDHPVRHISEAITALEIEMAAIAAGEKRWGRWKYDPSNRLLVLDPDEATEYWLSIDGLQTERERLNWIAQIAEKSWGSEVLGDFVHAVNDIVGLRQQDALIACRPGRKQPL